ncbi:MAG TPA: hypothetical protein PLA50_07755 [Bacteroidia bacterium]|nr:hypothetical protein [Bacteroidia bacterium]
MKSLRIVGSAPLLAGLLRNQPERRIRDAQDIREILRLHPREGEHEELRALCERYGPPGIYDAIQPEIP